MGPNHTVNDAEVMALYHAIKRMLALQLEGKLPSRPVRILGDS